jgi:hypothetical protein
VRQRIEVRQRTQSENYLPDPNRQVQKGGSHGSEAQWQVDEDQWQCRKGLGAHTEKVLRTGMSKNQSGQINEKRRSLKGTGVSNC